MAPSPYEFERFRKKKSASPWRLIALLCAIGLLTGGAIFCFYPKTAPAPLPPAAETVPPTSPVPAEKMVSGTPSLPSPGQPAAALPAVPEEPEKPAAVPAEKEKAAKENGEPVAAAPVKGQPWSGDAAAEADRPVVAEAQVPAGFADRLAVAQGELAAGNLIKVREEAQKLLAEPGISFGSQPWRDAAALLTRANRQLWAASPATDPESSVYMVRPGDTLLRVADRYHTTAAAIRVPNGIPDKSTVVKVGQRVHFTAGPWSVRISKKYRLLALYRGAPNAAKLFAVFDVGVGRLNSTPAGEFVIYDRCRAKLAPEFGRSFLKLAPAATPDRPFAGIGIHGTDDEHSVKRSQSAGCIRLRNNDIDFLYAALPLRSCVTITD